MKLLVIGHAQHGKDSVCEIIAKNYDLKYTPTSMIAAREIIMPLTKDKYDTVKACYEDRGNHRADWFKAIEAYNAEDPAKLVKLVLQENDIYCGIRSRKEFEGSGHLFDEVIYVDAHGRVADESSDSMQLTKEDADTVIPNTRRPLELLSAATAAYRRIVSRVNQRGPKPKAADHTVTMAASGLLVAETPAGVALVVSPEVTEAVEELHEDEPHVATDESYADEDS